MRLAPLNQFKPSSKIFTDRSKAVLLLWNFYVFFSVLCLLCLCVRLFICALRSPAWKGLTSWLSFVVSNCEFVTFPLVSCVRCGTSFYRFLLFAPLLTFFSILEKLLIKQCFKRKTMSPKLHNESASMHTALYWVTMIQLKSIKYFKREHAQTQFWSDFENTKCCGHLDCKVKVIEI